MLALKAIELQEKEIGTTEEERQDLLTRLYDTLDWLKGRQVLIDLVGDAQTQWYFENFSWNLFMTRNNIVKASFENEEDEVVMPVTIKIGNIEDVIIDDNFYDDDEMVLDTNDSSYYCESVLIKFLNGTQLRIELQW